MLNLTEYAQHRGCSRPAVSKALRDGRITRSPGGGIDAEQADKEWAANSQEWMDRNKAGAGGAPRRAELGNGSATQSIRESKAIREQALAERARIELEVLAGRYVEASVVRATAEAAARRTREVLEGIPSRLGSVLSPECPPAEVRRLLAEEVRAALGALEEWARGELV